MKPTILAILLVFCLSLIAAAQYSDPTSDSDSERNRIYKIDVSYEAAIVPFLFKMAETIDVERFLAKCAVFCTLFGAYKSDYSCSETLFSYSLTLLRPIVGNDTTISKELRDSAKNIFTSLYSLDWTLIEQGTLVCREEALYEGQMCINSPYFSVQAGEKAAEFVKEREKSSELLKHEYNLVSDPLSQHHLASRVKDGLFSAMTSLLFVNSGHYNHSYSDDDEFMVNYLPSLIIDDPTREAFTHWLHNKDPSRRRLTTLQLLRGHWIDEDLCLHVLVGARIVDGFSDLYPLDPAVQPPLFRADYSDNAVFGLIDESEAFAVTCSGSLHVPNPNWTVHHQPLNFLWQHFALLRDNRLLTLLSPLGDPQCSSSSSSSDNEGKGDNDGRQENFDLHRVQVSQIVPYYSGKLIYVVVRDYFSCRNVAHLIEGGKAFWTLAAAAEAHANVNANSNDGDEGAGAGADQQLLKANWQGSVLLSGLSGTSPCPHTPVRPFVALFYRALLRYSHHHNLSVHVPDVEEFSALVQDQAQASLQLPLDEALLKFPTVRVFEHRAFPILLNRPLLNVLTPSGAALMQSAVAIECELSSPNSPQALVLAARSPIRSRSKEETKEVPPHVWENIGPDDPFWGLHFGKGRGYADEENVDFLVLSTRVGPRHFSNVPHIVEASRNFISSLPDRYPSSSLGRVHRGLHIVTVNFGALRPCQQVALMSRCAMFLVVLGAEGGMISFMPPGGVVVEVHPAGCCITGFDDDPHNSYYQYFRSDALAVQARYYYFTGTIASSWLCTTWQNHMMISPFCGTHVIVKELEFLFSELVVAVNGQHKKQQ